MGEANGKAKVSDPTKPHRKKSIPDDDKIWVEGIRCGHRFKSAPIEGVGPPKRWCYQCAMTRTVKRPGEDFTRRCSCGNILSRYNENEYCWACLEKQHEDRQREINKTDIIDLMENR